MPRWRTMIEPAVTSWPSPALTPRRWPALSRPFLTLPPAFLWAISSTRPSSWRGSASERPAWRRRRRPWPGSPWWSWSCRRPWPRASWQPGSWRPGSWSQSWRRPWPPAWPRRSRRPWRSSWRRPSSARPSSVPRPRRSRPAWRRARRPSRPARRRPPRGAGARLRVALGLRGVLGGALAAEGDVADAQDRQLLAMALLDAAARLRAVLEGDDLLAAHLADDLGADLGVRDQRPADRGVVTVGDEEDALEGDRLAGLDVEELDLELRADLDAVLLPAGLDDCVHGSSGLLIHRRATSTWRSWLWDMGWRPAQAGTRTAKSTVERPNGQSAGPGAAQSELVGEEEPLAHDRSRPSADGRARRRARRRPPPAGPCRATGGTGSGRGRRPAARPSTTSTGRRAAAAGRSRPIPPPFSRWRGSESRRPTVAAAAATSARVDAVPASSVMR